MDFSIKTFDAKSTVNTSKTGCVVVGVFENKKLSAAATALDKKGDISVALCTLAPLTDERCNYNAMIEYVTIRKLKG